MSGKLLRRAQTWAGRREARVAGRNPWDVAVGTVRSTIDDRVTGLAAEMAFFALLSMVPLVVALGASLGWMELLLGAEAVERGRQAVAQGLDTVFSRDVAEGVMQPLVEGLLEEQRGGVALSSVAVSIWLASRVFTATIRALDLAYNVQERRSLLQQRLLALLLAVLAVVIGSLTVLFVVLGPLFGTAGQIATRLGFGQMFQFVWGVVRWPALLLLAVGMFATVYHYGPSRRAPWRESVPGAVLGVVLWLGSTVGLRAYLATFGSPTGGFTAGDEAVLLGVVGAVVAAVLWTYVSAIALLVGGELNAVLLRAADERT